VKERSQCNPYNAAEEHSLSCKPVDILCCEFLLPVTAKVAIAKVVRQGCKQYWEEAFLSCLEQETTASDVQMVRGMVGFIRLNVGLKFCVFSGNRIYSGCRF
jgi:hypothetical protein